MNILKKLLRLRKDRFFVSKKTLLDSTTKEPIPVNYALYHNYGDLAIHTTEELRFELNNSERTDAFLELYGLVKYHCGVYWFSDNQFNIIGININQMSSKQDYSVLHSYISSNRVLNRSMEKLS